MAGILAFSAAPAICKAENLMKIWAPPKDIVAPAFGKKSMLFDGSMDFIEFNDSLDLCDNDFTLEIPSAGVFYTFVKTQDDLKYYRNGEQVAPDTTFPKCLFRHTLGKT